MRTILTTGIYTLYTKIKRKNRFTLIWARTYTQVKKRKRLLFTITVTPVFNVAKGTDVDYSVVGSQGTDK